MVKTIKIPLSVHKELKIYIASKENERMADVAGLAIVEFLKSQGHKFIKNTSKPDKGL